MGLPEIVGLATITGVAIAALGFFIKIRHQRAIMRKSEMHAVMKPIVAAVDQLGKDQKETAEKQERTSDVVIELAKDVGRLVQRMDDHERQDTQRFDDVGKMFHEIRGVLDRIPEKIITIFNNQPRK